MSQHTVAALVADGVSLARRAGKASASGFVNAVLRAICRKRGSLPWPRRPADRGDRSVALDYLAVRLSHPRWLVARWYDRLGFDATEAWLTFNNSQAPLTLRVNHLRTSTDALIDRLAAEQIIVRRGRFAPDALVVERAGDSDFLRASGQEHGWFLVQDEASQLVTLLAGSAPGRRVLDTCASPGGKATALAAALDEGGLLVACDVRPRRLELLQRTVTASGATNIRLVRADLLKPMPFAQRFDTVLVDAPCSGLGTLRRDPDIRWRREEGDLAAFGDAQGRMLRHASALVVPGGRLVYATCSSEPEENEAVARAFAAAAPGFAAVDARRAAADLPAAVVDEEGYLRTQPHRHGLEAFFGAVFERRS